LFPVELELGLLSVISETIAAVPFTENRSASQLQMLRAQASRAGKK